MKTYGPARSTSAASDNELGPAPGKRTRTRDLVQAKAESPLRDAPRRAAIPRSSANPAGAPVQRQAGGEPDIAPPEAETPATETGSATERPATERPATETIEERVDILCEVYQDWHNAWLEGELSREVVRRESARFNRDLPMRARTQAELEWLLSLDTNTLTAEDRARVDEDEARVTAMVLALRELRIHARRQTAWEEFYAAHPHFDLRPALRQVERARAEVERALAELQRWTERTGSHYARLVEARQMLEDLEATVSNASRIACVDPSRLVMAMNLAADRIDPVSGEVLALASRIVEHYARQSNQLACLEGNLGDVEACLEIAGMSAQEIEQRTAQLRSHVLAASVRFHGAQAEVDQVMEVRRAHVLFGGGGDADDSWPGELSTPYDRDRWAGLDGI